MSPFHRRGSWKLEVSGLLTGPLGSFFIPQRRRLIVDKVVPSDGKTHSPGFVCLGGFFSGMSVVGGKTSLSHQPLGVNHTK